MLVRLTKIIAPFVVTFVVGLFFIANFAEEGWVMAIVFGPVAGWLSFEALAHREITVQQRNAARRYE